MEPLFRLILSEPLYILAAVAVILLLFYAVLKRIFKLILYLLLAAAVFGAYLYYN